MPKGVDGTYWIEDIFLARNLFKMCKHLHELIYIRSVFIPSNLSVLQVTSWTMFLFVGPHIHTIHQDIFLFTINYNQRTLCSLILHLLNGKKPVLIIWKKPSYGFTTCISCFFYLIWFDLIWYSSKEIISCEIYMTKNWLYILR